MCTETMPSKWKDTTDPSELAILIHCPHKFYGIFVITVNTSTLLHLVVRALLFQLDRVGTTLYNLIYNLYFSI